MASNVPERLHSARDPYPVLFGPGLLEQVGALLEPIGLARRVAVVTHRKLDRLYGRKLRHGLRQAGVQASFHFMAQGERFKTLETVNRLYAELLRRGLSRDDTIVALGGGVVGDTAGFVAATYLRGVPLVHVPTTLLAQIDSSIGGKVGVNHALGKNLVGAFYRPAAVWMDPTLLESLPSREFRSGVFEMLKYGFIGVPSLFRAMERSPRAFRVGAPDLPRAIRASVKLKLSVVRADERESSLRRILNFGHTIGHALEAAGRYRVLSHGEAVGWGMIAAVRLAVERKLIAAPLAARMERVVRSVGPLPRLAKLPLPTILDAVEKDKKRGPEGIRFVLPIGLGRVQVVESMPREAIRRVVESLRSESRSERSLQPIRRWGWGPSDRKRMRQP